MDCELETLLVTVVEAVCGETVRRGEANIYMKLKGMEWADGQYIGKIKVLPDEINPEIFSCPQIKEGDVITLLLLRPGRISGSGDPGIVTVGFIWRERAFINHARIRFELDKID